MPTFHDYTKLNEQITASDELKARVLRAARASKNQAAEFKQPEITEKKKAGRYSRGFSLLQKAAVAAILAICIPVTAYAAEHFGLLDFLAEIGIEKTPEIQEMVETFPSEAATSPVVMENGEIKIPEFRVTEALCDSESLYVVVEIKPMDDRYLLVPSELGTNDDIGNMMIPGVSGMTIEEYAASLGKEILKVGTHLNNDNEYGVSAGLISKCTTDGTVYQYWTGSNPSGEMEFPLTVTCLYHTLDMPLAERFTFDVPITDKSTSEMVKTFTQFEDTGLGITVHSLTIEETELGMYATFVYSTTDGETYHFALMDTDGEYLPGLPGSSTPAYEENGDGTYRSGGPYQKMDSLDGLQFRVMRTSDMEKIGPFKILG